MILWICPNGSMGLQIFVSADPALINSRSLPRRKSFCSGARRPQFPQGAQLE